MYPYLRLNPINRLMMVFAVIALFMTGAAQAGEIGYRPGELLVRFKSDQRATAIQHFNKALNVRTKGMLNQGRIHHFQLPENLTVIQALDLYRKDPMVAFAEPNYYLSTQNSPNDTHFTLQWGLHNTGQIVSGYMGTPYADIDALRAWQITTGSPEVVVAVVDTGVNYTHPDLAVNLWVNPDEIADNDIDDDDNGFVDDVHGWDFVDQDNTPMDASGHGTHVAGIIASQGDNGLGAAGVAWQVSIMPLRFLNAFDMGTTSDAIEAIEYAVSQGAKIINCSWGGSGYSVALREAMASSDALFICAAGNNGTSNDTQPFYPAALDLPNILSVAASDQMDHLPWFSNYGAQSVDVAAPGVRILNLQSSRQTLWQENFDTADITQWTPGGDSPGWDTAAPPYYNSSTALSANPQGNYEPDINTWLASPAMDLRGACANKVRFQIIGRTQYSADRLFVEASTDLTNWTYRPMLMGSTIYSGGISGTLSYWMPVTVDLGPWDNDAQVYFRFRFSSDADGTDTGFFIDNVSLTAADEQEAYQYLQGTSMAAAFVSGVAALVKSQDPTLTTTQIKSIIGKSVDLKQAFKDITISGGRINAFNALTLLEELSLSADAAADDAINLTWTAQTPLNSQITIERRSENETTFQTIAEVAPETATYADNDLVNDTTYYYRVQAETSDGRSGYSPQTEATTGEQSPPSSGGGGGSSGGGCFIQSVWN